MTPVDDPRWRWMVRLHRAWREMVFVAAPKRWWLGVLWRWLFLAEDGSTHRRVGEKVLADLRDFAGMKHPATFQTDPLRLARAAGRRDVVMRICHFLKLDETQIQHLVEIDDE